MRSLSSAIAFSSCSLLATSCTPPSEAPPAQIDQRVAVPAAGEDVLQFVMPEQVIPAGADVTLCFIPSNLPTDDVLTPSFESSRAGIAVHADAMMSVIPRDAGQVFDCTNPEELVTLTPLFLPNAPLPPGFVVRMVAGKELVIRTHYVNDTGSDVLVADVSRFAITDPATAPAPPTEVANFVVTSTNVFLAQGPSSMDVSCVPSADMQVLSLAAHMNTMGKSVRLTRGAEELYSVDAWSPALVDTPPTTLFPPEAPLVLRAGEQIDLSCSWNNTAGRDVFFPEEICASFSYAFPANGQQLILCDAATASEGEGEGEGEGPIGEGEGEGEGPIAEGEGEGEREPWTPDPSCPEVPEPNNECLPSCGNDKFVGQPCTVDGGECSGHGFGNAIFCTVDFEPAAPLAMCTKPCQIDSQCGDGAVCIGDPNDPNSSKGCVPVACAEEP